MKFDSKRILTMFLHVSASVLWQILMFGGERHDNAASY